jgi:hypothetical protein
MPRSILLWVYGPWAASALVQLTALRLLLADDAQLHGHGWSLLGSGMICFSIGCVAKVSFELAQAYRRLEQERRRLEQLASR